MRSTIILIFLISITTISVSADNGNMTSTQQNDEKQLVSYTEILAIGTIAIGVGTIFSLILTNRTHQKQIKITSEQNKMSALMEIFTTLREEENRNARRMSYVAYKEYKKTKDIAVFRYPVYYKAVSSVASHFNQVGMLIQKNVIPEEEFFDLYADTTILCWKSLKDHIVKEQEDRKSKFYMNQFVWLGEQAETYWEKHRPDDQLPEPY